MGEPSTLDTGLGVHLVKISNYLIEQPQTLQSFMVDVRFRVEFLKVRHRCKEDTHTFVGLVVEVLRGETLAPGQAASCLTQGNKFEEG